jgi:undecaprenyl-diphosphatase
MMSVTQAIILGVVQGLTEFLPVSSSGHLLVLKHLFGVSEVPILFDVLLHIATLLVVILVFRRRIGQILAAIGRWIARRHVREDLENLRLAAVIIVASVFTGVMGIVISGLDFAWDPRVAGALFIVTAVILIASQFTHGTTGYATVGFKEAVITGIAQGFGVFPGISRSGISISGALFAGLSREKAGEFAFLIAIPAIVGALGLTLRDAGDLAAAVPPVSLIAGLVASFLVGLVSILVLLRIVKSAKLWVFSLYLVPLGVATLLLT